MVFRMNENHIQSNEERTTNEGNKITHLPKTTDMGDAIKETKRIGVCD